MTNSPPSFASDIAPFLYNYRGQMAWRLDLTSYEDVKANAQIILDNITYSPGNPPNMPPPPFQPFSQDFVSQFQAWVNGGCQP